MVGKLQGTRGVETFLVTKNGLKMQLLVTPSPPMPTPIPTASPTKPMLARLYKKTLDLVSAYLPSNERSMSEEGPKAKLLPPLLFVHGSYHSSWCWAEHFLPYFASLGYPCYAVSLRGTGPTGTLP